MTIPEMLIGCLLRIVLPGIAIFGLAAWVGERVERS